MQTSLLKRGMILSGILCSVMAATGLPSQAAVKAPEPVYTLDVPNHQITIHNTGNVTAEINSALTYLANRQDTGTLWKLQFDGGKYVLSSTVYADKLQNVALMSNPNQPAILTKGAGFPTEYIFSTRFSYHVSVRGFTFIGNTETYNPNNYLTGSSMGWQDQGLYFGSCNGVIVSGNRFLNIGNAAVRITTAEQDPIKGVNSINSQITQNYFDNVFQVTTTSNDTIHGGTAYLLVQDNTFDHLWGSIKFASRTPGATNVIMNHNTINSSATDGIEIVGYNNVDIINNSFQNIARNAANCYSNEISTKGFEWGDNINFKNNTINHTGGGIRLSADAYLDGFQPQPKNVTISDNTITNLTGSAPALTLLKSTFPGLTVSNNQFSGIPSKVYLYLPLKPLNVIFTSNKVDSKLLSAY